MHGIWDTALSKDRYFEMMTREGWGLGVTLTDKSEAVAAAAQIAQKSYGYRLLSVV